MHDPHNLPTTAPISQRQVELEQLSKDELVKLLLQSEGYAIDGQTLVDRRLPTARRPFDLVWEADDYTLLPEGAQGASPVWRLTLVSFDLVHPLIGLDVAGDVLLGRDRGDASPDLDLSPYDALRHGVSRRHALLFPTQDGVQLMDLDSTNVTRRNDRPLSPHEPVVLADQDVMALGSLRFQVRIVGKVG